jgi:hypothetical protein
MKAILITAIIVVVILAVGVPVIYYAVNSADSGVSTGTVPTGQVVGAVNHVQKTEPVKTIDTGTDEELSAKEMLAQIQNGDTPVESTAVANDKVGYSINYLIEQRKLQAEQTCQPLVDAAQKKLDDAEAIVASKKKAYENARDELDDAIDAEEDDDVIDDARDDVEAAKNAYEHALQDKFSANEDLVDARINCVV